MYTQLNLTGDRSTEDDGGDAVGRLAGDGRRQTLAAAVELVAARRRPIGRVVVADAAELADRRADHDVGAVHARSVADRRAACTRPRTSVV